jgi:hypothetical protein
MHHLSSYLIGGFLTVLAIDSISGGIAMPRWSFVSDAVPTTSAAVVNRGLKGDRLTTTANVTQPAYRSVKVAGELDAFAASADPMRSILFNATPMTVPGLATQNFGTWTIGLGTVAPSPATLRLEPANRPIPTKPPRMPDACDSAFSPIAAPALAHIIGRCLT